MEQPAPNPFPVTRIAHIEASTEQPAWLIASLWGQQAVGFVGGTPKSCKTWLALEMAVAVASGHRCLGRFAVNEPGHALLYAAEDSAADIRRRVTAIACARNIALDRLAVGLITEPALQLDQPSHQTRLDDTLAKLKPRLLVLDPLVRLHRGDENSATDTSALLSFLRALQRQHGCAIVVVHHIRKGAPGGQPGQALRGSGDLHAWSDSNLFLLHRNGRIELHAEHRNHPAPQPLAVVLATAPEHLHVNDIDDPPDQGSDLHRRVIDALTTSSMTRTALRECLRIRNETLGDVLAKPERDGAVLRIDGQLTVPHSPPEGHVGTEPGPATKTSFKTAKRPGCLLGRSRTPGNLTPSTPKEMSPYMDRDRFLSETPAPMLKGPAVHSSVSAKRSELFARLRELSK